MIKFYNFKLLSVNCNKNDNIVETILLTTSSDTEKLKFIRVSFFTGVNFLHVECNHIMKMTLILQGKGVIFVRQICRKMTLVIILGETYLFVTLAL